MHATDWHYVVIWEFYVADGNQEEFRRGYGPRGEWAALFSLDQQYRGTELIQDFSLPGRYLTLDYWASREAYLAFRQRHASEYQAIDQRFEKITQSEKEIGAFTRAA